MKNSTAIISVDLFIDQTKCEYFENTFESVEQFLIDSVDGSTDCEVSNTLTIVQIDEEHTGSISYYTANLNVWYNEYWTRELILQSIDEIEIGLINSVDDLSSEGLVKRLESSLINLEVNE
jgi:hypothetical protein